MPTTYKCPSCGAAMEFDSDTQKMKCPQCQRIMDVSEFDMDAADGNYDENTDHLVERCSQSYHEEGHNFPIVYADYYYIEAIWKLTGEEIFLW